MGFWCHDSAEHRLFPGRLMPTGLLGFSTDSGDPALVPAGLPSLLLSASQGPPVFISVAPASCLSQSGHSINAQRRAASTVLGQGRGAAWADTASVLLGGKVLQNDQLPPLCKWGREALTSHPLCLKPCYWGNFFRLLQSNG